LVSDPIPYDRIALFYDACVPTTLDVPFFVEEAARAHGPVLELMAGTGRVSLPLIEAGADVTCIDYSMEMLAVLRRKLYARGLEATLHRMDVRELTLGQIFALVIVPFHAFTEITDLEDERRVLARIYDHVADDGRFICTLHNPTVRLRSVMGVYGLWSTGHLSDGSTVLLWGTQAHDDQIVNVEEFYEVYDQENLMQARHRLNLNFRLLDQAQFEAMAAAAGFEVEALYGDYQRAPFDEESSPYMIWILRKTPSERNDHAE
jgi:SAM-dependent methyltransferase